MPTAIIIALILVFVLLVAFIVYRFYKKKKRLERIEYLIYRINNYNDKYKVSMWSELCELYGEKEFSLDSLTPEILADDLNLRTEKNFYKFIGYLKRTAERNVEKRKDFYGRHGAIQHIYATIAEQPRITRRIFKNLVCKNNPRFVNFFYNMSIRGPLLSSPSGPLKPT